MSIEMENPQSPKELVDAAWNHVEQIRTALMLGDQNRAYAAVNHASRLLSVAVEKLEEAEYPEE